MGQKRGVSEEGGLEHGSRSESGSGSLENISDPDTDPAKLCGSLIYHYFSLMLGVLKYFFTYILY